MYNFDNFKKEADEACGRLARELLTVRTGRASPALLDGVMVESYGAKMPIQNIASISVEDAQTLRVQPWDKNAVKQIESAITQANLGVSLATDAAGVRVIFPSLTSERRVLLTKIVGEKLETARVAVRKIREETWASIQNEERAGKISEDEKYRSKDILQKHTDEAIVKLEECAARKRKEIEV